MAEPPKLKPGKSSGNYAPPRSNPSPENSKQSPLWFKGYEPSIAHNPDTFIGFAEYLRWMRSPDTAEKDKTKLEILQLAAKKSESYKKRLEVLTDRTKRIAGEDNTFEVTSTWRIRVGGQRGPESMLLPAWDALGIPYIPSSTLRGVARDRAIREFMAEDRDLTYNLAVDKIAPYFGSIDSDTQKADRMGKVIFLDAYPVPANSGALAVDIANNIWKWDGNLPKYGARPFAFLSLLKTTFVIGIKPTQKCNEEAFDRVKGWLIAGLQSGIGSRVISGYGELLRDGGKNPRKEILKKPLEFIIEGQLIHGVKFTGKWDKPVAEVRPIAFRSMLRYWFRAFALGVLTSNDVEKLEAQLFGSIDITLSTDNKPIHGWVSVQVLDSKLDRAEPPTSKDKKNDPCGRQSGKLILRYSESIPIDKQEAVGNLLRIITWFMFHLGGVGQGARRPLYSRATREKAPWWRGSDLKLTDKEILNKSGGATFEEFQRMFKVYLGNFYKALSELSCQKLQLIESKSSDAIDLSCGIFICQGDRENAKPFALSVLHADEFKIKKFKDGKQVMDYDPELCGKMQSPSPVWICNKQEYQDSNYQQSEYQVVTVFGANIGKRKKYVEKLLADRNTIQVFPMQ